MILWRATDRLYVNGTYRCASAILFNVVKCE